jgi:hypothetical protein
MRVHVLKRNQLFEKSATRVMLQDIIGLPLMRKEEDCVHCVCTHMLPMDKMKRTMSRGRKKKKILLAAFNN